MKNLNSFDEDVIFNTRGMCRHNPWGDKKDTKEDCENVLHGFSIADQERNQSIQF